MASQTNIFAKKLQKNGAKQILVQTHVLSGLKKLKHNFYVQESQNVTQLCQRSQIKTSFSQD